MEGITVPKILQDTGTLQLEYPEADAFTEQQLNVFWLPEEIKVEKDIQDILVNMTEAERHGVITVLKLFTLYELRAGSDYWLGRFMKRFKRHELQRMASTFGMFELSIHKPFYAKINEALHIDTDEFYNEYVNDETLSARMKFIADVVRSDNDLYSIGAFTFIEGAVLYSSFAFLKHFQSKGKNKLLNVVRGINFSVRDENLHALAGAWAFRTLKEEKNLSPEEEIGLEATIRAAAEKVYEHECRIVDMIFEKGEIEGTTPVQLKHFVESRINQCLQELGYKNMFEVKYNPIADWFYDGITGFSFNDFFSGVGNSYTRNWSETDFVYEDYKKDIK